MATQTKTTDVGPVGLIPMGAYSASATYSLLMTVLYNHDSWVCIAMTAEGEEKDITGIAPDDPTYGADNWQALTDGGRAAVAEAAQMRTEFNAWFGATPAAGIRKTVDDWIMQVQATWNTWFGTDDASGVHKAWSDFLSAIQAEWNTWFGTDASSGVHKAWEDFLASIQSAWDTWFGTDATEGVQKDWADTKADAVDATGRANTAAGVCEDMNAHPAYIADGTPQKPGDEDYWYLWDHSGQRYVRGSYAKGDDIDWSTMSEQDKDDLAQRVLDQLAFATVAEAEAAAEELT